MISIEKLADSRLVAPIAPAPLEEQADLEPLYREGRPTWSRRGPTGDPHQVSKTSHHWGLRRMVADGGELYS